VEGLARQWRRLQEEELARQRKLREEEQLQEEEAQQRKAEEVLDTLLRVQREAEVRRLAEERIRQQALERMMREEQAERAAQRERIMQPLRAAYFQRKDAMRAGGLGVCFKSSAFHCRRGCKACNARAAGESYS